VKQANWSLCRLCQEEEEALEHILECPATALWRIQLRMDSPSDLCTNPTGALQLFWKFFGPDLAYSSPDVDNNGISNNNTVSHPLLLQHRSQCGVNTGIPPIGGYLHTWMVGLLGRIQKNGGRGDFSKM